MKVTLRMMGMMMRGESILEKSENADGILTSWESEIFQ